MSNARVLAGKYRPLGYQQITSLSSATGLTVPTSATIGNPVLALISCEDQNVRWRDDGTNPTTTVGMLLTAGSELAYSGDLGAIKFIEVTASAELNISYYG